MPAKKKSKKEKEVEEDGSASSTSESDSPDEKCNTRNKDDEAFKSEESEDDNSSGPDEDVSAPVPVHKQHIDPVPLKQNSKTTPAPKTFKTDKLPPHCDYCRMRGITCKCDQLNCNACGTKLCKCNHKRPLQMHHALQPPRQNDRGNCFIM